MASRLLRVALTGGIATGKSFCLAAFARQGAPTIDADVLARRAVGPSTAGLAHVVRRFGSGVLRPDGSLDRKALGRVVFVDPAARRDLEAIVHPLVYAGIHDWFLDLDRAAGAPDAGRKPFGVAEIPLLYETGHAGDFDCVVVAACSRAEQVRRVMARDRLTEADASLRLDAQLSIDEKRLLADYVVDTEGSEAETGRQVGEICKRLRA